MNSDLQSIDSVEIDLAFTAFEIEHFDHLFINYEKDLLSKSQFWRNELRNWMRFIRSKSKFYCPEVVRRASMISLGVQLTDDLTIRTLNERWLNKSSSTDVLSFPIIDEISYLPLNQYIELGDIIVSVPTAKRQSKENGNDLSRELRWLVSHGFLHLLGWDHIDDKSLDEMLYLQDEMLKSSDNSESN
tara:strand:- start:409 stop:972 length:564 start_codon:yes stop_codon:yes gene_type:complete